MKKSLFILLLSLLGCASLHAYDAKIDNIYYNFSGDKAEVTYLRYYPSDRSANSTAYSGNIVIPESVNYDGKPYSVTSIGDYAFCYCDLTSVTIPNTVTSIGRDAFYNCGLTSITIPSSVTSIGRDALYTSNLEKVIILDIAAWCNITFMRNVFQPGVNHHLYLNSQEIKNLVIPEGITKISNYAFYGCGYLESVTIPESVTAIGSSTFAKCITLTSVFIPNSVTTIGNSAFYECI